MVSATLKIGQLISWNTNFEIVSEDREWAIYYYSPNGRIMLKIVLDDASKAALKAKRDQVAAFCNGDTTLSGSVAETWKLEDVDVPFSTVNQWVKK
jgi:hypothetical protein